MLGRNRRLLVLSPTKDRGGAEEHMLSLAAGGAEASWEVIVSFQCNDATRGMLADLRQRRVRYVGARIGFKRNWRVGFRQLAATLTLHLRVRPAAAVIFVSWPDHAPGCIVASGLLRVPTAVVFALAPWPISASGWAPFCRWARMRRQRWIAVSEQNRAALAETFGVPASSLQTICNGAPKPEPLAASSAVAARAAVREELDLPTEAQIVLTVGRLNAQKGHDDLIDVMPRVLDEHPDTFFVWAGEGPRRAHLEASLRGGGLERRVRMLGHRRDIDALMRASDLFVLPSHYEGQPLSLLEAMAYGLPVVSSDAGGIPELICHQVEGLIHRRSDPADLLEKLNWALDHPREMQEMSARALLKAGAFPQRRTVRETLAAVESL